MSWTNDLRYALRLIRQHPWFSATIIVTIALGIGVNTTVFTLVNAVLFKPLPFPGGDRMVMAAASQTAQGRDFFPIPYLDIDDIRQNAKSLERVEAFSYIPATITEKASTPERYRGARVTPGLFQMLEVRPVLGRIFNDGDGKAGAEKVVLLSHSVWKDRYAMDPQVINRAIRLNEEPAVIVGVLPEGFQFPSNEKVWTAAQPPAAVAAAQARGERQYMVVSRTKPGTPLAEAQADLDVIASRLAQQFPDSHKDHGLRVRTFHQAMNGGPIRLIFLLMLGAVGFVLLIACANVANLLLSRVLARRREISVRAAMGASRWRLLRQLLFESVTLSVAGGLVGLIMARFGVQAFAKAVANVGKPYWIDFTMDWMVVLYFALVCVGAGVLFGIAPALSASKVDLNETLKEGARDSGGKSGGRLASGLVVFQYALAVVLLSGAGLMIRSFLNAANEYGGIPAEQILVARVGLPDKRYGKQDDRRQFFDRLTPRVNSIPGVVATAFVSDPPGFGGAGWRVEVPGHTPAAAENDKKLQQQLPAASVVVVSPGYFSLLETPLLRGRDFTESDGESGKEAVIVSRMFATRLFGKGEDPVGKKLRFYEGNGKARPWMTIAGIAPDIRQQGGPGGDASDREPVAYVAYRSEAWQTMHILLKTAGSAGIPAGLPAALRSEIQQLDGDLPLVDVDPLAEYFNRTRWYLRVFGALFTAFAAIAMGMAAIGIYGVIANSIGRRTREIGVRLAMGAESGDILGLMMRRGLLQIAAGLAIGLAAALGVCRLMASLLFQVSPSDPVTFITVATVLLLAGLLACWLPARRAARLDPVIALRYE